ncbi:MAG: hypothetical protein WCA30_14110 [Dermatophilaceae bacterium]
MALDRDRPGPPSRDVLGDWTLTCGVVALVLVLMPVIGDVLAGPVAVVAVVLGVVGLVREHRGGPLHTWRTLVGGLLGAAALLLVVAMVAATGGVG